MKIDAEQQCDDQYGKIKAENRKSKDLKPIAEDRSEQDQEQIKQERSIRRLTGLRVFQQIQDGGGDPGHQIADP